MRNFKRLVLLAAALVCVEWIAVFCLEPVTYTYYLNKDQKKLEQQGRVPDVVLVGDSRIYRSFIPEVIDEELGDGSHCTINTGTGSQTIQGSYYYLKDLLRVYPVKYAVVELTYACFLQSDGQSSMGDLVVLDRMRSPVSRLDYILHVLEVSEWPYVLKSYRYRNNLTTIPENISMKLSAETRKGVDVREDEHYEDRGFVWTQSGFEDGATGLPQPEPVQWESGKISAEAFEWLDRIRDLCRQNGVELILVTGPTTLSTIYSIEDYEGSYQCFSQYAKENDLPYFELNLLKNRREILPDSMMRDSDHVCGTGAEVTSRAFCDIVNAYLNGEDTEGWFYTSVDEMKEDIGEVVACDLHTEAIEGSSDRSFVAESLQEEGKTAEYEFWICRDPEAGSFELLQEYGVKNTCVIPAEDLEHDIILRVNSRLRGSGKEWEAYMEREKRVEG